MYTLDLESYKAIFTKVNEYTVSSPSEIHYGHYIVAVQDDFLAEANKCPLSIWLPFRKMEYFTSLYGMEIKKTSIYH